MSDELRFDLFTLDNAKHIIRMFEDMSLTGAEIMAGVERAEFYAAIVRHGWAGSNPAWAGFKPVVILPHGTLIKHDQFVFLIDELAG